MNVRPVILIVLDGFGIAPPGSGNAITAACPKTLNSLLHLYPNTQLSASGESVGLPSGEVGSTEVGHLNLGAGRIVYQSLPRINLAIADGSFYKNEAFLQAAHHVHRNGGDLHLLGLVGSGTVHASLEHLYALMYFSKENDIKRVFIHVITDGRDSPPNAARHYVENIEDKIVEIGVGKIASIMGRYYAMDRDRRWDRIERAYRALTYGEGKKATSWRQAIEESYAISKTDEFIEPTNIVDEQGRPLSLVKEGDAMIFFNFRVDRPRELTKAFVLDDFESDANITSYDPYAIKYYKRHEMIEEILPPPFKRGVKVADLFFVTMTEYDRNLPVSVAFPQHVVHMPLGRVLAERQLRQLRIAESEKERFVTFYFNGLREAPFAFEERLIVPSPKVPTYNLKPEMSTPEITRILIKKLYEQKHSFFLVNFANPDMVGHSGDMEAAVAAVTAVDRGIAKIVDAALKLDDTVLITADHGNIEEMVDFKTGLPSTEHTGNPVPFIAISNALTGKKDKLPTGILADVAPTVLTLLGIRVPEEMTGQNLLEGFH